MLRIGKKIKLDSMWKWSFRTEAEITNKIGKYQGCGWVLRKGVFKTPMHKSHAQKDGREFFHYQAQPWETWKTK